MRKKQELNEQFFKNSDQAGVIVRDFLVVGGLVVTAEGVDEYVVRSSRAAKTSAARRLVRVSCADDCADCGPGDPHHDCADRTTIGPQRRAQ